MREDARRLLAALGVDVPEGDPLLEMACEAVEEQLENETNQDAVPEGLRAMAAEMAAGRVLGAMKDAGRLEGFDLDAAVKQVQEGDASVTFAVGSGSATPEQRLDALIARLRGGRLGECARYRRLEW